MYRCNHLLGFLTLMFVGFAPASVLAECKSASIMFGKCSGKISGLATLFKQKNNGVAGQEILQGIYKRQMQVPYPTKSPVRRKSVTTRAVVYIPEPLPIENTGHVQVVSNSTNKSLSKFGPDAPAELIVRCTNNQLKVLLNFPGYPMNDRKNANSLSYQIDHAATWTAQPQPANEFSAIDIWENRNAYKFLSSIVKGRKLHINAQDLEATEITANFNIPDIINKLRRLDGNCHLPT